MLLEGVVETASGLVTLGSSVVDTFPTWLTDAVECGKLVVVVVISSSVTAAEADVVELAEIPGFFVVAICLI